MQTETFRATTQYSDFKGGAAADHADNGTPAEWLRKNGHITPDDFLVGIEFSIGENHGIHRDPVYVNFLIVDGPGRDNVAARIAELPINESIEVRRISTSMSLIEFFSLFKRFSVTLSPLNTMQDRDYTYAI
ncbi:hypothetical protein [Pseudomonas citronellolis]|uniref:hypothetical protein n=1 Tax=Pseudomonas citronellolis TaxID=53408 RepID=UPI0023E3A43F|nr:hypothetical protein [Pseudomonas citronellolis]MDF3935126.1 hypothetical protein [Pseudomonas citronellolis]